MTTWTSAHLRALDEALAKGVRRVSYADRSVEYGSVDEMLKLRAIMRVEIEGGDQGDSQLIFAGRVR